MENKTTKELIEIFNNLTAGDLLKNWKKSKALLIAKIEDLEYVPAATETPILDICKDTEADQLPPLTSDELSFFEEAEAEVEVPEVAEVPKITIRELAITLMCKVTHFEDKMKKSGEDNVVDADHVNARSVGLPYNEVIDGIKAVFPDSNTSIACLRWYAVKVRGEEGPGYEGFRLCQRRPRVKS